MFLLALVFSFCCIPIKGKGSSDYLWPIKEFDELSSGFGDYRSFHFHSGIDIPTEKETGYEVLAPDSGWVYRLYTSWWGYGKALYLKLADGRLALFGHLSDFSAKIKDLVQQRQLQNQSYFLDLFPDKNEIRVSKGEVLGYSGESGTGAAHLHFELRDEENQPLNPLTHGFTTADSTPPVIDRIALRPLGINSFVNGKNEVAILPLVSDPVTGNYTLNEPPLVSGRIGLEVRAYDKVGRRKLGIYESWVYFDNELIFSCAYDTLNFDNTWMVDLDRDFQLLRRGIGHYYRLYVDSGNDLNLYLAPEPDRGTINTERYYDLAEQSYLPAVHRIKIWAGDASGNLSQAQFLVIFDRKPEISISELSKNEQFFHIRGKVIDDDRFSRIEVGTSPVDEPRWEEKRLVNTTRKNDFVWTENTKTPTVIRFKAVDDLGLQSDPQYLFLNPEGPRERPGQGEINLDLDHSLEDGFLILVLKFDSILREKPQVSLKVGGFQFSPVIVRQMDEKTFEAFWPFSQARARQVVLETMCQNVFGDSATFVQKVPLAIASPVSGGEALSEDGVARIEIDSGTVQRPVELRIRKIPSMRIPTTEVDIYSFEPQDVPFAKSARVSLSYHGNDCDPHRLALYEYKDKSWHFVGNELNTETKVVSGKVRCLSTYALIEDERPPKIKIIYPKKERRIKNKLPQILARIWDDLSGFGSEDGITVTVDDLWAIPEYDPEKAVLKVTPSRSLSYGWHTLTIVAQDRVGNLSRAEQRFKVVK